MSDSVRPHRRQPTRLPCPWDSPDKNTGVGCHFLLQCMKVKSLSQVRLLEIPWTAAHQDPPSMGFSRQEYWSGLPLPSPLFTLGGFQHLIRVIPSMGVPLMQLLLVEYTVGFLTSSLSGHPPLCTCVWSHHTMLVLCEDDLFLCLGCGSLFSITITC